MAMRDIDVDNSETRSKISYCRVNFDIYRVFLLRIESKKDLHGVKEEVATRVDASNGEGKLRRVNGAICKNEGATVTRALCSGY